MNIVVIIEVVKNNLNIFSDKIVIFVKQIKAEKMNLISLPIYEGFNQFAIWPSQQSVSTDRLKSIIWSSVLLTSNSAIYHVCPLNDFVLRLCLNQIKYSS